MNIKRLTYIGLFACLTALGALITVPIPPLVVPITLQIPFTLTAGFILGPRDGAVSQLLYLLLGAVGLPVFSGQQGGIGMLWGPTAGFYGALSGRFSDWMAELPLSLPQF